MDFAEQCYVLVRQIPKGKVSTYKAIAEALGCRAYRAVGRAMRTNPEIPSTPCHRVITSSGHVGRYLYGVERKKELLEHEGVRIEANGNISLAKFGYFDFKKPLNT